MMSGLREPAFDESGAAGTKEQSDACIALGRLAAWAEAAMHGHYRIEIHDFGCPLYPSHAPNWPTA